MQSIKSIFRKVKPTLLVFLILLFYNSVWAQNTVAPNPAREPSEWIQQFKGKLPLVISVPHGGLVNLDEVPDRSCKDAVTVTDSYTIELAREISEQLTKSSGFSPTLIICQLVRKDVDQNRPLEEGTCGNELMKAPWEKFHTLIDSALADAIQQWGFCLYIDLHGHGHTLQRLEIGYGFTGKELKSLALKETSLEDAGNDHSLKNLNTLKPGINTYNLIFGDKSFGSLMAEEGFPSIPSNKEFYPDENDKYFSGGYNTRRYTSSNYPKVIGWQIESNMKGVRDSKGRPVFAQAFSKVILNYLKENLGWQINPSR